MSKSNNPISFNLDVSTKTIPPLFIFNNENGQPTNGSVTVPCDQESKIVYTLSKNSGFKFKPPSITNNFYDELSYDISSDKLTLTIKTTPTHIENVGLQLIVKQKSTQQQFASPDPKIRSVPS